MADDRLDFHTRDILRVKEAQQWTNQVIYFAALNCKIADGRPIPTKTLSDKLSGDKSSPAISEGEGPGLTGLKLSAVNERLQDLEDDTALPQQEREQLRKFYTHERNKLQLRLAVLGKDETLESLANEVEEARKSLDFARSESGRLDARRAWQARIAESVEGAEISEASGLSSFQDNPEDYEIRKAETKHSLVEASLSKVRIELETVSAQLERLSLADGRWEQPAIAAKRWELSRKWEALTPDELRPAVEAIRHAFEHYICWRCEQSTMTLCFAALHPASPNHLGRTELESLEPYTRFLIALLGAQVKRSLLNANHPAPVIFKSYLDVLETSLKIAVREGFKEMFEIAKVRAELLGMHPVDWSKRHLQILVSAQKRAIRVWIKEVCDPPNTIRQPTDDDIFRGRWRAPRFIHMKPAGNTLYDQASARSREELVRSEELLDAQAERVAIFLRIELDEVARRAHVAFAKQGRARVWGPKQKDSDRGVPARSTSSPVAIEKQALVGERSSATSAVQGSVAGFSSTEVGRRDTSPDEPRNDALREVVIKKVQNPQKYTVLSVPESALYFEVQPRTIYRWNREGNLRTGGRRGSITIESVLKFEKKRSRKRRDL